MTQGDSLRDLQTWMQSALIHPQATSSAEVAARLTASNRLTASERLGIYQRSYIARLRSCLAEQFPASRHALGAGLFDQFARLYLATIPSTSHTLYDLGAGFPGFLQDTRPDADAPEERQETWVNFMIDLARYERTLFVLFDAPGHEGKPWPTRDTPDAALVLQPCFALGAYRFPVACYYHSVTDAARPGLPPMSDSYVALARFDYLTASFPITRAHHRFLQLLTETHSIDTALAQMAQTLNRAETALRASWRDEIRDRWIANHFFVDRAVVAPPDATVRPQNSR